MFKVNYNMDLNLCIPHFCLHGARAVKVKRNPIFFFFFFCAPSIWWATKFPHPEFLSACREPSRILADETPSTPDVRSVRSVIGSYTVRCPNNVFERTIFFREESFGPEEKEGK